MQRGIVIFMLKLLDKEVRAIVQIDPAEETISNGLLYAVAHAADAVTIYGLKNVTSEKLERLTKRMRYVANQVKETDNHDVIVIVEPTNYLHLPVRTFKTISKLADVIGIPYVVNTRNRRNLISGGREKGAYRFYDGQQRRLFKRMSRKGIPISREQFKKHAVFVHNITSDIARYTNATLYQSLESLLSDVEFEITWGGADILHHDWSGIYGDPIKIKEVRTVRDKIGSTVPIVVSGNISTPERGIEMLNSGADAIILGNELKDIASSLSVINGIKPKKNSHNPEDEIGKSVFA